jgi:phosphatidate cytidylyltransferase
MSNIATTILGIVYVTLPLSLMMYIPLFLGGNTWQPWYFLFYLFIVWANDVFAYLVGITMGKHRLCERISPKKSWEGSVGGALVSIGAACIVAYFDHSLTLPQWLGFALVVVVFGTWGDLVESLLKRQLGIKDSGNILPGHGGMLDRFDSSLLAIPAAVVYLYTLTIV